jgi:hypothetical protein
MQPDEMQRAEFVETTVSDQRKRPAILYAVVATSLAGLLLSILRWQLVAIVTVFIEPLIEFVVFGVFLGVFLWALVYAFIPFREFSCRRFTPIALALMALLIFVFVPFTKIVTMTDFALNLSKRTAAAESIIHSATSGAAISGGRGDRVSLPGLSDDGQGFYWHTEGKQMVFFFTFRGILGHFSGFVYSANDAPPADGDFGARFIEIKHLHKNWYWAASH